MSVYHEHYPVPILAQLCPDVVRYGFAIYARKNPQKNHRADEPHKTNP